jgi:hypothetical protein
MREEATRLQTAIDAMRQTYVAQSQTAHMGMRPSPRSSASSTRSWPRRAGRAPKAPSPPSPRSARSARAPPRRPRPRGRSSRASRSSTRPNLGRGHDRDFITALNFPETAEDREGFRALRRAMQDRRAAELITASQDILTLLSQEGIYMDDLTPDRARPEIWRRFAEGQRGKPIATLGGIRDRSCLALTAARMRNDPSSAMRPPFPAEVRPRLQRIREARDRRRDRRAVRNPHRPRLHASGPRDRHLHLRGAQRRLRAHAEDPALLARAASGTAPRHGRERARPAPPRRPRASTRTCTASFMSPGPASPPSPRGREARARSPRRPPAGRAARRARPPPAPGSVRLSRSSAAIPVMTWDPTAPAPPICQQVKLPFASLSTARAPSIPCPPARVPCAAGGECRGPALNQKGPCRGTAR